MNDNPYSGFSFDDFLQKEDLQVECTAIAIKRVLTRQLEDEMKRQNLTKTRGVSPSVCEADQRRG